MGIIDNIRSKSPLSTNGENIVKSFQREETIEKSEKVEESTEEVVEKSEESDLEKAAGPGGNFPDGEGSKGAGKGKGPGKGKKDGSGMEDEEEKDD